MNTESWISLHVHCAMTCAGESGWAGSCHFGHMIWCKDPGYSLSYLHGRLTKPEKLTKVSS